MIAAADLCKVLRDAAVHQRAHPDRHGKSLALTDAADVVVAGDLHGNIANCKAVLAYADLDAHPRRHLVLQEFVHSKFRYDDGADASHRLLDLVAILKCKYPQRLHLLMGNHELSEWTGREIGKNGESLNGLFVEGVRRAHGAGADDVLDAYDDLFASMLLAVRTPSRVLLTHSIPAASRLDDWDESVLAEARWSEAELDGRASLYHLVWDRQVSAADSDAFAQRMDADLLVTGHIAQPEGYRIANGRHLIVDCVDRPAGFVHFPATGALDFDGLLTGLRLLSADGQLATPYPNGRT